MAGIRGDGRNLQAGTRQARGSPAVTAGLFGGFIVVMIVNGAFLAALGAVLKAVLYVWAEEDSLPEGVDADQFDNAFVQGGIGAKMMGA